MISLVTGCSAAVVALLAIAGYLGKRLDKFCQRNQEQAMQQVKGAREDIQAIHLHLGRQDDKQDGLIVRVARIEGRMGITNGKDSSG